MKDSKPVTVGLFVGILLIVVFGIGLACERDPGVFIRRYRYDFALEQFCSFCREVWLPAGIIGFPLMLICLFVSLARDKKADKS